MPRFFAARTPTQNITSIDTSGAEGQPGVIAVYTGADTDGVLNGLPCAWLIPNSDLKTPDHPAIAKDRVRYVGDAVAVVVAESRYQAEDALEHIEVDYEPLGVVMNPRAAAQDGAPQIHDDVPNNVAFTWALAGGGHRRGFLGGRRHGERHDQPPAPESPTRWSRARRSRNGSPPRAN